MAGKHHDLVNHTKKYKGESHEFYLDMKSWKSFKTRYRLEWQKTRFDETHRDNVPEVRGLYSFTVQVDPSKLPNHGYILYVGITGNDSENANLRKRFTQYLNHWKNEDGRPAVFYMLSNFAGDLFFNFVPLSNENIDLEKIEASFIRALMPPINKRDLGAKLTAVKAAKF